MAFVDVALVVGSAVGLEGGAAVLGGGALIGAGVGGLYSGITGDGNILNSMLTGGLIGGAGAYGLGSAGVGGEAAQAAMAGPFWGTPASTAVSTPTAVGTSNAVLTQGAINPATGLPYSEAAGLTQAGSSAVSQAAAETAAKEAAKTAALESGKKLLGYGLAGTAAMQLLGNKKPGLTGGTPGDPGMIRPYEFHPNQTAGTGAYPSPYATASYDAAGNPVLDTRERNYFDQQYTAMTPYSARSGTVNPNKPIGAATGGLMAIGGPVERMTQNVMGGQGNMFPQSQQEHTYFATPTQMPASAEVIRSDYDAKTNPYTGVMMAKGGLTDFVNFINSGKLAQGGVADLGDYSDGGRLLKGPGDGVSDDIPATIAGKQPARLADGEFVIPARIVSEIGNGSTDAGAKRLYAMMDRIQEGRKKTIGKKNVAKDTKAKKHLLA
jgi:hypothetical protein